MVIKKLNELKDEKLLLEYMSILSLDGTKLLLKLNIFEKKIGVKND